MWRDPPPYLDFDDYLIDTAAQSCRRPGLALPELQRESAADALQADRYPSPSVNPGCPEGYAESDAPTIDPAAYMLALHQQSPWGIDAHYRHAAIDILPPAISLNGIGDNVLGACDSVHGETSDAVASEVAASNSGTYDMTGSTVDSMLAAANTKQNYDDIANLSGPELEAMEGYYHNLSILPEGALAKQTSLKAMVLSALPQLSLVPGVLSHVVLSLEQEGHSIG